MISPDREGDETKEEARGQIKKIERKREKTKKMNERNASLKREKWKHIKMFRWHFKFCGTSGES